MFIVTIKTLNPKRVIHILKVFKNLNNSNFIYLFSFSMFVNTQCMLVTNMRIFVHYPFSSYVNTLFFSPCFALFFFKTSNYVNIKAMVNRVF